MMPALFVQDIQNTWLYDSDSDQDLRRALEKRLDVINEAITWFRVRKLPIIVGYTDDKEHGLLPGTKSFEVPDSVKIRESDFKVTKHYSNAFGDPRLGAILREQGCDTMVIVGLSASGLCSQPTSGLSTGIFAPTCSRAVWHRTKRSM